MKQDLEESEACSASSYRVEREVLCAAATGELTVYVKENLKNGSIMGYSPNELVGGR